MKSIRSVYKEVAIFGLVGILACVLIYAFFSMTHEEKAEVLPYIMDAAN